MTTHPPTAEHIRVIPSLNSNPLIKWEPEIGEETLKLLEHSKIPEDEQPQVRNSAALILSKCTPPFATNLENSTGLVLGYVQSGKTMSFTTVTTLAKDNDYRIIIIIAGTSIALLNQSTNRLKRDLQLDTRPDRQWQHFQNPTLEKNDHIKIRNTLEEWEDVSVPEEERKTVLITVMKHHRRLEKLAAVLSNISLKQVPTLIIDDEADQAGLNTAVNEGERSTTYNRILGLKDSLSHHTFIQYTATPQAPLLINIIDVLSPDFVQILQPGKSYVGGKEFFISSAKLVRRIPDSEIPTKKRPLDAPPNSLLQALRIFFVGVASGIINEKSQGNRSMMVHPSRRTLGHHHYFIWISEVIKLWKDIFALPEGESDRHDLLEDFQKAYNDLSSTVPDLPTFSQLVERLPHAIRRTHLEEVNAKTGKTPTINWKDTYSFILVGGQSMDRGFTVEGLTVTYMPRGGGVGNADTIQQRARFFGYKKNYQGYCRVFLENRVEEAYHDYIIHEENIRKRLSEHDNSGRPLSEWKRAFFLTRKLKPTRENILDLVYVRGNYSRLRNKWYTPKAPHDSVEAVGSNYKLIQNFITTIDFGDDKGHTKRTKNQKHKVAYDIQLNNIYENLLIPFRVTRLVDSQQFTGLLLQIEDYLEYKPDARCTLYHMLGGKLRERRTEEALEAAKAKGKRRSKDEIPTLFQGRNPLKGEIIYPGDGEIRNPEGVTIQIWNLRVITPEKTHDNVPALTVWLPEEMTEDWLVQPENIKC